LADIRIRQQTAVRHTLRDGLRAIVAAGYDITRSSDLRPVLELADRTAGVSVLAELYDEMRARPEPAEIESLWRDLGIEDARGELFFPTMRGCLSSDGQSRLVPNSRCPA
jgi:hypothetical protein